MLLKSGQQQKVIAFSPLLYRFKAPWVADNLPVHDGTLEAILNLDANLILTGEFNSITLRKRLQQLGRPVSVLSLPTSLDGVKSYISRFLEITGGKSYGDRTPVIMEKKQGSMLILGANGIASGTGTMEHDILTAAGWNNYLEQPGFQSLSLEQLVIDPPTKIFYQAPVSQSLSGLFARHQVLSKIESSRTEADAYWKWQCPGPWTFDLIDEVSS